MTYREAQAEHRRLVDKASGLMTGGTFANDEDRTKFDGLLDEAERAKARMRALAPDEGDDDEGATWPRNAPQMSWAERQRQDWERAQRGQV